MKAKMVLCNLCEEVFPDEHAMELHQANEFHCTLCGATNGKPWTKENVDAVCTLCEAEESFDRLGLSSDSWQ